MVGGGQVETWGTLGEEGSATPDSVISINDDDSKDGMIDLTSYDELVLAKQELEEDEEEEDSTEARLRADTERVLRILRDESGPPQEWNEVCHLASSSACT